MKLNKIVLKKALYVVLIVLGLLYGIFLFVIPPILRSDFVEDKFDEYIYKKIGVEIDSDELKITTHFNFNIELNAEKIIIQKDDLDILKAKDIDFSFNLLKRSLEKVNIDYIYFDDTGLQNLVKKSKKKNNRKINLTSLSEINVENMEVWIDKGTENSIFITVNDLKRQIKDGRIYYTFEAEILSDMLKNSIDIGKKGGIYLKDGHFYADNLEILIGNSSLNLDGEARNVKLYGKGLPICDIMSSLLYFQKKKEPGKKFIENFYDYAGNLDIDMQLSPDGIYGHAIAHNLSGKSHLFNVPIIFPKTVFLLKGDDMFAESNGKLGNENVYTSVNLDGIMTKDFVTTGIVKADLHNEFAKKYISDLSIKENLSASVSYKVKDKKVDVDYILNFPKNSDLLYQNVTLGLENKNRKLSVHTHKENNNIELTHYEYSAQNNQEYEKIIYGEGLFTKENDKYTPDFITCKTKTDAPVSVAGSFFKYVEGGVFTGDLVYHFKKNIITGIFNIKNSKYKDFIIDNANVNATENNIQIDAKGTYQKSPFECKINALNKISKQIKIYDMYLFLNEYIAKTSDTIKNNKLDINKIRDSVKDIDFDVDKWTINLNKLKRRQLVLNNILITGNIHNKIFNYDVPEIKFAGGTISGNGNFNYIDNISEFCINAKNIDSNMAAGILFELPNQIYGTANAVVKAKTIDGFKTIKSHIDFKVKDGFLAKLGNTEFMIKKSKMITKSFKVKVSDVVNVDLKNRNALSSDLKGSLNIDNAFIHDVKITSAHKFISILIEGDYNIESQYANLKLYGKYNNKAMSKVKVFFVPVSLIMKVIFKPDPTMHITDSKLNEVPKIQATSDELSAFSVNVNGNINTNDVKVELKSIK